MAEKAELLERLVVSYPDAIWAVGPNSDFILTTATSSQWRKREDGALSGPAHRARGNRAAGVKTHTGGPSVRAGSGILAFLPSERKSYVHAFANEGVPTYMRVIKNIHDTEAVQVMTGEDDARDTAEFCRISKSCMVGLLH